MRKTGMLILVLALAQTWVMIGCTDDDDPDPSEQDTGTEDPTDIWSSVHDCTENDHYTVDNGNFCNEDLHCKSGYCDTWSSIPRDPEAKCADGPADDKDLIYKTTVVDFETREPIPNVVVKAAPAMRTQTMGPKVTATQTKTSDENGRVEFTFVEKVDLTDPIAEVVLAEHEGYFATGTGVVEINPDQTWPKGSLTNNMVMVGVELVDKIKTAMEADPNTKDMPVLGKDGGSLGRLFLVSDGSPVEGAILQTRKAVTTSIVLYPNADYSGFQDKTSANGSFIIFFPGAGEKFDVLKDGEQISAPWNEGTTGSTAGLIFAIDMWIDDIPWCKNISEYVPD